MLDLVWLGCLYPLKLLHKGHIPSLRPKEGDSLVGAPCFLPPPAPVHNCSNDIIIFIVDKVQGLSSWLGFSDEEVGTLRLIDC